MLPVLFVNKIELFLPFRRLASNNVLQLPYAMYTKRFDGVYLLSSVSLFYCFFKELLGRFPITLLLNS